jgi:hypothetical protein
MWLHILKKDLRLHWPYVAAVLALKIAAVWIILHMGIFAEPLELVLLHTFSDLAFAVVAGFAIIVVVQSDPVVSNNDDWLIRPIRRSDLALDKIAFAALVTFLPTFVFDLGVGLIHGLDTQPAISASAYTALVMFIGVGLPALAVGTITASWSQAAGIVFAIFLIWIAGFKYSRRNTTTSRGVLALATICAITVMFTPTLAGHLILRFTDYGKVTTGGPIRLSFDDQSKAEVIGKAQQLGDPVIYVPLKVVVDPNRIVTINRVILSIASNDGKPLYSGIISVASAYPPHQVSNLLGNTFDGTSNGHKSNYQAVNLPSDVFAKFKNTPGRLTLTYLLNSYAPVATVKAALPFGAPQKVAGFGVCETRLNPANDQVVDLYCFPATNSSKCIAASALDPAGASIGAPQTRCWATSTRWGLNTAALTDPGQFVVQLPTADGAGIRPLTLTSYRAAGRFIQTVVLPQVRLTDLQRSAGS